MKTRMFFLILLAQMTYAETGEPEDIPEAGRIRIDGQLNDWKNIEWTPLEQTLYGSPANISNARWALRWSDGGTLYIAVCYDDSDIILQNHYVNSNTQDCVEIFVRGDTGKKSIDYSKTQRIAQHYIFGLAKTGKLSWRKLSGVEPFPIHNPAKAAIVLSNHTFTYEIEVPVYDQFFITSRRHCDRGELYPELEIGVDIMITDVGKAGFAGKQSENRMGQKARDISHIAEHTLGD